MLQNVQITNMNFEKLLEHKMFFLSMPSFVSAVLFIPSFNVLSCYFYDSLNLVAVPTAWILTNFGTQLLYNVTLLTFATNNSPQLNSLVALTVYRYSIFQTLQRKLFQRKCKPITMSEEPHKINNLVNNQKINIIEKLCHLQFPLFVFFSKPLILVSLTHDQWTYMSYMYLLARPQVVGLQVVGTLFGFHRREHSREEYPFSLLSMWCLHRTAE